MYDTKVADQKTNNYTFWRLHLVLKHFLRLSMRNRDHKKTVTGAYEE